MMKLKYGINKIVSRYDIDYKKMKNDLYDNEFQDVDLINKYKLIIEECLDFYEPNYYFARMNNNNATTQYIIALLSIVCATVITIVGTGKKS